MAPMNLVHSDRLHPAQFAVRQAAGEKLAKFGADWEPLLRQVLDNKPSAEVRKRLETHLDSEAIQRLYWAAAPLITRLSHEQKQKVKQMAHVMGLHQVAEAL